MIPWLPTSADDPVKIIVGAFLVLLVVFAGHGLRLLAIRAGLRWREKPTKRR